MRSPQCYSNQSTDSCVDRQRESRIKPWTQSVWQGRQNKAEDCKAERARAARLLLKQLQLLEELEKGIKEEDTWVKNTVKATPDAQLLMSIPGVGEFSALVILAELGNISRFKRSAQVANFAGLTPSISQSGETKRTGRITKVGSPMLRWVMIQDAWRAITNYEMRCHFASVSRRCGSHAAIVAVARKLLQIAYRVLRDQKPFDPNLVGVKSA